MYRLLDFMRKYKRGAILGPPGTGKTRLSTWCVCRIVAKDNNKIYIYTAPLRKLRDYIYWYFKDHGIEPFRLVSHEEYEPIIERYKERFNDYIKALKYHLDNDDCRYKEHWEELIRYIIDGGQVIVATHVLGIFAWLLLKKKFPEKKIYLIIDEGEDYFIKLSTPITEDFLKALKTIDKRIYRKFRSGLKRFKNFYFYQPLFVQKAIFYSYIISATFPQSMLEVLIDEYDYPVYHLRGKKSRDIIVYLDRVLKWEEKKKVIEIKWVPKLLNLLDQVLVRTVPVGFTSRRKELGEIVLEDMVNRGWRVSQDVTGLHIDPHADLWILTIGGKFYRGISFKPLKGRIRRGGEEIYDFRVAVGTYQKGEITIEDDFSPLKLPWTHPVIFQLIDDPWRYNRELRDGINVQSLFRFNRYKDLEHTMIILDRRLYNAVHYYLRYYVDTSKKIRCKSFDEIHAIIRKIF